MEFPPPCGLFGQDGNQEIMQVWVGYTENESGPSGPVRLVLLLIAINYTRDPLC